MSWGWILNRVVNTPTSQLKYGCSLFSKNSVHLWAQLCLLCSDGNTTIPPRQINDRFDSYCRSSRVRIHLIVLRLAVQHLPRNFEIKSKLSKTAILQAYTDSIHLCLESGPNWMTITATRFCVIHFVPAYWATLWYQAQVFWVKSEALLLDHYVTGLRYAQYS